MLFFKVRSLTSARKCCVSSSMIFVNYMHERQAEDDTQKSSFCSVFHGKHVFDLHMKAPCSFDSNPINSGYQLHQITLEIWDGNAPFFLCPLTLCYANVECLQGSGMNLKCRLKSIWQDFMILVEELFEKIYFISTSSKKSYSRTKRLSTFKVPTNWVLN